MKIILVALLSAYVSFAAGPRSAQAHDLEGNTAQVSLRDGNLRIHLRIRADALPASKALQAGTLVKIDGRTVPLKLRTYPNRDAVMRALASAAIEADLGAHAHPAYFRVDLESEEAGWVGNTLSVQFPRRLGPVLVSFVQPKTQLLSQGATAAFDVLTKGDHRAERVQR